MPFSYVEYAVGSPPLTTPAYDTNFASCATTTFDVSYKNKDGGTIDKPNWLTHTNATRKFEISTSYLSDIAVVTVTLSATVDLYIPTSSTSWGLIPGVSTSFTIAIYHACRDTTLEKDPSNLAMEVLVT